MNRMKNILKWAVAALTATTILTAPVVAQNETAQKQGDRNFFVTMRADDPDVILASSGSIQLIGRCEFSPFMDAIKTSVFLTSSEENWMSNSKLLMAGATRGVCSIQTETPQYINCDDNPFSAITPSGHSLMVDDVIAVGTALESAYPDTDCAITGQVVITRNQGLFAGQ